MFSLYLGVIEAVARLDGQATAGAVQRMNLTVSLTRIKSALKALEGEGYLTSERVAYKATGATIYHITDRCAENVLIVSKATNAAIVEKYRQAEKDRDHDAAMNDWK